MRTALLIVPLVLAAAGARADSSSITSDVPEPSDAIERGVFYFGFGFGLGASTFAEEAIAGKGAGLFSIRTGAILGKRFLVGPEVTFSGQYNDWAAGEQTAVALSSVLLEGMAFPVSEVPWNVSLGAGWGSGLDVHRLPDDSGGGERALAEGSNGLSWMAGTGWDFFAGRGWNLGLQLRYDGAALPELKTVHGGSLHVWFNSY